MRNLKHHLRNRILLLYAILISASLLSLSAITYLRTSDYLRTSTLNNLTEKTALLQTQLNQIIDHYSDISDGVLGNAYLHSLLVRDEKLTYEEQNWLDTYVGNLTYYENLDNAMLVDTENTVYLAGPFSTLPLDVDVLLGSPVMESAYSGTGRNKWHILRNDIFLVNRTNGPFIYLERKMNNLDVPGLISGYSVLQLSKDIFSSLTKNIDLKDSILQIVYDEDQTVFFDSRGVDFYPASSLINIESNKFSGIISQDERDFFVSYKSSNKHPFSLIYWVSYETVNKQLLSLLTYSLYILLGTLLCLLIVGFFLSSNITKPVENLSKAMRRFGEGEVDVSASEGGKGEILMLQKQFNVMSAKIRELMVQIEDNSEEKRSLELKMLRYQINPHFLYNFLDSLNWLALEANQRRLAFLITALARFYRLGLMKEQEIITLEEEFEFTRYYLVMAQFRSGDSFTFNTKLPEELTSSPTIRMGLQPMIENSIKHGFSFEKMSECSISISAKATDKFVIVTIEDNGKGMSAAEVEHLNTMLSKVEMESDELISDHIGMRNVNRRIKLHFGAAYGLKINSEGIGKGCSVRFFLPKEKSLE